MSIAVAPREAPGENPKKEDELMPKQNSRPPNPKRKMPVPRPDESNKRRRLPDNVRKGDGPASPGEETQDIWPVPTP